VTHSFVQIQNLKGQRGGGGGVRSAAKALVMEASKGPGVDRLAGERARSTNVIRRCWVAEAAAGPLVDIFRKGECGGGSGGVVRQSMRQETRRI
jgi:hypothetical protein